MRGKVILNHLEPLLRRITPAYAGKRGTGEGVALDDRDHPRLCGEKYVCLYDCTKEIRITPAYAGKSITSDLSTVHGKDHPRLCGEKEELQNAKETKEGSPPPMRGKAKNCGHVEMVA